MLRMRRRAAAAVAVALLGALPGCGPAASTPGPTPVVWAGAPLTPPLRKPAFTLTDDNGRPYDFAAQTKGKVALLYFGYTHCPDLCPLVMATAAAALQRLPSSVRARIVVVFVTVDPERDTPARLRQWLSHYNAGFVGLTGRPRELAVAQQAAGAPTAAPDPSPGIEDHAGYVLVYSPDGYAHLEFMGGTPAAGEARDLQRLASGQWPGGATHG